MFRNAILLALILLLSFQCGKDDIVLPAPNDTFWITDDPANHQFDAVALDQIKSAAANLENIYAFLVVRNGKLVVEEYYNGKNANSLLHLRSVTKNITSALAGIAVGEGLIANPDVPLEVFFPDLLSGDAESVTLRHMLNMASGFEWDENTEINALADNQIPDPLSYLLSRPLSDSPGSTFNYNSLSPHIVGEVISTLSGMTLKNYAQQELFTPIGINSLSWQKDPTGQEYGGFGLQLTARDLAKFGFLYLNNGSWEGEEVVPAGWVEDSFETQIETTASNTGYSYQWWISRNLTPNLPYGQGYGGQFLAVSPEKDLIVVGLHEHFVIQSQNEIQWNNFAQQVLVPVFNAAL